MLTITSLLSILFMTLHLTSDTVTPGLGRPRQGARPSLWCPSWSSGCTERWCSPNGGRGIIMLVVSLLASGMPLIHVMGAGGGFRGPIAQSRPAFLFVLALPALRGTRVFSLNL